MTEAEEKNIDAFKDRYVSTLYQDKDPARQLEAFDALDKEIKAAIEAANAKAESKADFRGDMIATFGAAVGLGATLVGVPALPAAVGATASFVYAEKKRAEYALANKVESFDYTDKLNDICKQIEKTEKNIIRRNADVVLRDEQLFVNLPHMREKWMEVQKEKTQPTASSKHGLKKGR